jgi:hypothetical protein
MRNAIMQLPETRSAKERRFGLRAAKRALNQLRRDLDSLLRHLSESRDRITG